MSSKRKGRRSFMKKTGSAVLAGTLGFNIVKARNQGMPVNQDTLKVGLKTV